MKTTDETLAKNLLRQSGLSWCDAVRLVVELHETVHSLPHENKKNRMARMRLTIRLGAELEARSRETVPFRTAVQASMEARRGRRPATVADLRYLSGRLLRLNPALAERPLRAVDSGECRRCLETAFASPSQFKKGRAFLHSVFEFGKRRGWCAANPVARVETPTIREREIEPLTLPEVQSLTQAALTPEFRDCAPALGVMLWAGVRPCETSRLRWEDIDWEENVIVVRPQHSKTGGARHVSILPVLQRWLRRNRGDGGLCPANWKQKWRCLRLRAGFRAWQQDALRHTFASYHAKWFRDLPGLSFEMGHADLKLLRSRYINLAGLTREDARLFWSGAWLDKKLPSRASSGNGKTACLQLRGHVP